MENESSEYECFRTSSNDNRRLQCQEKLIVEVTEALAKVLNESSIRQTDLARRLGTSEGYVSQLLNGGRNLTLRALAGVADALGCAVEVRLREEIEPEAVVCPHGFEDGVGCLVCDTYGWDDYS